MTPRSAALELLCPARDLETGNAAIDHGADAVYIGAPRFGARAAAGNSVRDIASLVEHAHRYWSRVYVTLNTILYDHELEHARVMAGELYDAGVDALIIQDMGLLEMDLPPIPLIASTQTHNYDLARIQFLEKVGFQRVILARELSLSQIREIRQATSLELEFFVHGALCVSFSGQCFFSQAVTGRSANRGECAQMCRLPYTLVDGRGNILAENQHVLSLKDLNLSAYLPELVDAGITSFKVEGRLKDVAYVKNVTAFYRAALDRVIEERTELRRASSGSTVFMFSPDPERSFSRGATDYFLHRRNQTMVEFRTPKSIGKMIGTVRTVGKDHFQIDADEPLHNGDGVCFFDDEDVLRGTHVNRADGIRIFPKSMEGIVDGLVLYRNYDHSFAQSMKSDSAKRKIGIRLTMRETGDGFALYVIDEDGVEATQSISHTKEPAAKPEAALESLKTQLGKLGETRFSLTNLTIELTAAWFIPLRVLNQLRRDTISALETARANALPRRSHRIVPNDFPFPSPTLDYRANVVNDRAADFYKRHGVETIERGLELQAPAQNTVLMTTRYCAKFQFDLCRGGRETGEDLFLLNGGNRYRLEFDCDRCVMNIVAPDNLITRTQGPHDA